MNFIDYVASSLATLLVGDIVLLLASVVVAVIFVVATFGES